MLNDQTILKMNYLNLNVFFIEEKQQVINEFMKMIL